MYSQNIFDFHSSHDCSAYHQTKVLKERLFLNVFGWSDISYPFQSTFPKCLGQKEKMTSDIRLQKSEYTILTSKKKLFKNGKWSRFHRARASALAGCSLFKHHFRAGAAWMIWSLYWYKDHIRASAEDYITGLPHKLNPCDAHLWASIALNWWTWKNR